MSEKENRLAWLLIQDHFKIGLQILNELVERFDEYPVPVGFAVSRVVKSVNSVSLRDEMMNEVSVPAGVIRQPVNDEQASSDFSFRKPALVIDIAAAFPFECSVLVNNGSISLLKYHQATPNFFFQAYTVGLETFSILATRDMFPFDSLKAFTKARRRTPSFPEMPFFLWESFRM